MMNRNDRTDRRSRMSANLSPSFPSQNGGCNGGCNGSCNGGGNTVPSSACRALLSRLQTLDFSIVDTVLYLDAYPECREALKHYHELLSERDALLRDLSEKCNLPVTSFGNTSRDAWDWVRGPWPWEPDAN